MTIQLANKSIVQPLGVLEDVLVQVNKLIFPADFYMLDMEDETSGKGSTLIMGRPFLMTARTKIDMHVRTLSMEFASQPDPKALYDNSLLPPQPMELKPLPRHLKYAYLDTEQQLPIIIANNLSKE
ncbi:hypothetical protein CR513_10547, partial [Mucuna pruriens]